MAAGQATAKPIQIGDFIIAEPIRCKNLAVFPVLSKTPRDEDQYITLEEGLKAGKVEVYEVGAERRANPPAQQPASKPQRQPRRPVQQSAPAKQAQTLNGIPALPSDDPFGVDPAEPGGVSADVNHLMVVNRSDKPLYLMPGEIIYGGQQDRCVGQECIIMANGKPMKIEVFCVEHGRWSVRGEVETQMALDRLANAPGQTVLDENARKKLAEEAKQGKFVAQAGNLGKASRMAVQEGKGQQEVWNQVGVANAATGVQAGTGAFTANYTSPDVLRQIEPYLKELEKPVAERRQVVGAIVAVNGEVEGVDVFASTPLFRKVWPKLLKSHALDAAAVAKDKKAAKTSTLKDAEQFFRTAMQADVKQNKAGQGGLVVTKRESKEVVSYSASDAQPAAKGMGGMGGFGGGVHSSGYKK